MRRIRQSLSVASLEPIPVGGAGFSDKVTTTPLVVQDAFGYGGVRLPADGLSYCGPTAVTMSLLWLGKNGWTQIAPAAPQKEAALTLDRVLGGLAHTSALGGTYVTSLQKGVGDYFNAKGIPSTAFSWALANGPTISSIASHNVEQTVVTLVIGWYQPIPNSRNAYQWVGGHFVAILGQDEETGALTIGNPCPSSLKAVPDLPAYARQTLTPLSFNGTSQQLPEKGIPYLQFQDITWPGSSEAVTPVLQTVIALTVDTSQRLVPPPPTTWTPSIWTLEAQRSIDTNSARLAVLAPLSGAGGLAQEDSGDLVLEGANATSGPNAISGGSLACGPGSSTPSGGVAMGNGRLVLDPGGFGAAASLSLPGGVSFSGAAELELVVGMNKSLAVSLGAEGGAQGLTWEGAGTLAIIVDQGAEQLGHACTLTAPGGIGGLQNPSSPIVSPSVVAKRLGVDHSDFLSFSASAGFTLPPYTTSTSTDINDASAADVYLLDNDQVLDAGADVSVYALNVRRHALSAAGANATLNVGAPNELAGLILNEAVLSGFQLNFGASNAAIYAGGSSKVSSVIAGSGGLTVFGPGTLWLSATNGCTGEILVQSGTLEVSGASGTGSGPVVIQGTGTLGLSSGLGTVSGAVQAQRGGTIVLAAGTAAGGVSVDEESTLSGTGVIQGEATISGQIVAGSWPGVITFDGAATLEPGTLFVWTLFFLNNSYQGNSLAFNDPHSTIGQNGKPIIVLLDMTQLGDEYGPNNMSNTFWQSPQTWTIIAGNKGFQWVDAQPLQPQFKTGYFSISYNADHTAVYLNFNPKPV